MAGEAVSNPGVYVCGTPSGGTSCVAGILHHLGIDMGNFDLRPSAQRGYLVYEDRDAAQFKRPAGRHPGDSTLAFAFGPDGLRDFRSYLAMREEKANGLPWGCKLGTNHPMSDPDPATLPVRWVFVHRPLEESIASDLEKTKPSDPMERTMQIAGYWAAKEWLAENVAGSVLNLDFECVKRSPHETATILAEYLSLPVDQTTINEAARSVWAS